MIRGYARGTRSADVASAVDDERLAGHVFGIDQIEDRLYHIIGRPEPREGRGIYEALCVRLGPVVGQQHRAGRNGVHAKPRRETLRERACNVDDASLGGTVRDISRPRFEGREISNVDDDATLAHAISGRLRTKKRRAEVEREDLIPHVLAYGL